MNVPRFWARSTADVRNKDGRDHERRSHPALAPGSAGPDTGPRRRRWHLKTVLAGVSGSSFRIYRTAAGFRVRATDPVFKPGSAEAEKLMTQLDADPAFVRLCRAQESFRARLTPKPWRCGCERPAVRFPREHAHDEERFSEWLRRYGKACDAKATCRVVEEVGLSSA